MIASRLCSSFSSCALFGAASFMLSLTLGVLNMFYILTWNTIFSNQMKMESFDFVEIEAKLKLLVSHGFVFTLVAVEKDKIRQF